MVILSLLFLYIEKKKNDAQNNAPCLTGCISAIHTTVECAPLGKIIRSLDLKVRSHHHVSFIQPLCPLNAVIVSSLKKNSPYLRTDIRNAAYLGQARLHHVGRARVGRVYGY